MDKLLPCPFCGGEADATDLIARKGRRDPEGMWFVQCDGCNATFPHFDTETEAAAAWNRRAQPEPPICPLLSDAGTSQPCIQGPCLALLNKPLTLDELREMTGKPVFAIDGEGHRCWVVVNAADGCCADNEFGSWSFSFYEMADCTKDGLHPMGWRAYRTEPERSDT